MAVSVSGPAEGSLGLAGRRRYGSVRARRRFSPSLSSSLGPGTAREGGEGGRRRGRSTRSTRPSGRRERALARHRRQHRPRRDGHLHRPAVQGLPGTRRGPGPRREPSQPRQGDQPRRAGLRDESPAERTPTLADRARSARPAPTPTSGPLGRAPTTSPTRARTQPPRAPTRLLSRASRTTPKTSGTEPGRPPSPGTPTTRSRPHRPEPAPRPRQAPPTRQAPTATPCTPQTPGHRTRPMPRARAAIRGRRTLDPGGAPDGSTNRQVKEKCRIPTKSILHTRRSAAICGSQPEAAWGPVVTEWSQLRCGVWWAAKATCGIRRLSRRSSMYGGRGEDESGDAFGGVGLHGG